MTEVTAHSGLLSKTKVHVEDTGGTGRPVVLIHGWPLSGASWSENVPALRAAGYRAIAYDRRGFGQSDKPHGGYDYDTLADDLDGVLTELDLHDVTLVGFSMGGGEVARYVSRYGEGRLRSVVFASAVPPFLAKTENNPRGPLTRDAADEMEANLKADRHAFFDEFTTNFFTADGELKATEEQRQQAIAQAEQSDERAALQCMAAFGTTDFRTDLPKIGVPTLVIHGDADAIVPVEGSGALTHDSIPQSRLHVVEGGPHGLNVTHAEELNRELIEFLKT